MLMTPVVDFRASLRHSAPRIMTQHEWHELTPEGDKRYFRARHQGKIWKFDTTLASDEDWHAIEDPDREYLDQLRDILFRKYQRKRIPHRLLAEIETMIEDLPADAETDGDSEE